MDEGAMTVAVFIGAVSGAAVGIATEIDRLWRKGRAERQRAPRWYRLRRRLYSREGWLDYLGQLESGDQQ